MTEKACAGGRRRMRKFRINELSAVDGPAQEPALAVLMKRAFSAEERQRLAASGQALPDGSFPIVTRADLANAIQAFGRAGDKARAARHIKRRARALGATDLLPDTGLLAKTADSADNEGGSQMPDNGPTQEQFQAVQTENEELKGRLERAESISALPAEHKAHFDGLDEEGQTEFLAMSKAKRKSAVEKAAAKPEDNPVVYTDADGIEYRKNDDSRLIAGAKRNDLLAKKLADSEAARETERIEKRAKEELPNYPGEITAHVAIVRAVEGIEDEETRKAAFEAIKAGNMALGKNFVELGGKGELEVGGAEAQLDALAKRYATEHKVNEAEAYAKVLETEEGKRLYEQYTGDAQPN